MVACSIRQLVRQPCSGVVPVNTRNQLGCDELGRRGAELLAEREPVPHSVGAARDVCQRW